jgi:hypothetical protein
MVAVMPRLLLQGEKSQRMSISLALVRNQQDKKMKCRFMPAVHPQDVFYDALLHPQVIRGNHIISLRLNTGWTQCAGTI